MATSTYMTYLMHKETSAWEKLIDITEFPDIGSDPELLETTTLSDSMKTYILGLKGSEGLNFAANYDHAEYLELKGLEGKTEKYAIWFGATESEGVVTPSGSEGKFEFDGQLSAHVTSGSTNQVRGISIMIAPSTPIVES